MLSDRTALGVALLLAVFTALVRGIIDRRRPEPGAIAPRPVPTVLVGVLGGVVVGLTSVGSGSLILVSLSLLYPGLTAARLVGNRPRAGHSAGRLGGARPPAVR